MTYFPYVIAAAVAVTASNPRCKCTPTDACWPYPSDWTTFNTTLSGALIHAVPPASVCYLNEPNYNEDDCAHVRERWFDSTFHGSDPVSIDYPIWTNDSCNPIFPNGTSLTGDVNAGARGCNADTYPAFVVNATSADQVAVALKWASKKNIRVVVKATGHSYTGRSIGASSLSIWTHNFRGLEYIPSFSHSSCHVPDPISAVRVAAGHTNGEIQEYLSTHSRVIVSGANPSVGIVGWLTGGGHGFLSSSYGMGSDNLLEATIVLPSGETVVVNPCQHASIFSAIRGGGGGTFGVVTEVVLKTYPSPRTTKHVFTLSSLPDTPADRFWDTMGHLHTQMQRLKEGGMQGYYYIAGPPLVPSLSFTWVFMLFDKRPDTLHPLLSPIEAYLSQHTDLFAYTSNTTHFPTYSAATQHIRNEPVATGGSAYGSRLLSPASLSNGTRVADVLRTIGPSDNASHPDVYPPTPPLEFEPRLTLLQGCIPKFPPHRPHDRLSLSPSLPPLTLFSQPRLAQHPRASGRGSGVAGRGATRRS
ncbi:hypothetical protein E8E13_002255 [Curvularia kusanoi]|uniref:FAD-binding PCMH-type domain-containing protein n=1 Tax=Curvularia kusanoi TaxID=90978 RepID=A0A9P4T6I5_CURKU|nr:hypothetical protein E8E13_002255 [Curvularia kusanoi]